MYLDLSTATRNNGFQIPLAVVYFIISQRCIFGSVDSKCTDADVDAQIPCGAVDNAKSVEKQCSVMRSECCLRSGSNANPSKCYQRKTSPTDQSGDRGSCIKAAILDKKQPRNEFLNGDVIVELKALSELQCWDYCLRHAQCKAYNYQKRGQDKPLKTCQLLSSETGLKSKEDFTFHDFEQNDADRKATCVAEELRPRDKLIYFSFNKEYLERRSQENADENNAEVIQRLWPFMNFLRPPEDVKNFNEFVLALDILHTLY